MAAKRKKRRAFEKCAVIYLRYSTHNQTDLSIEYQREITEKYCADRGYTVVKHFIDEAKSGTTDKRDLFQAEALFNRVQDKMNDNRKSNLRSGGKRHYMLGGMSKIYCAECGSAMVGAANKSHGKTHRYYVCPKHKQKSCKLKNLRADYLEKLLCVTIVNKTLNKNNYTRYNDLLKESAGKKPGKGICKELAGVKKAIDNILKVLETHPTDEAMEHFSSLTAKKDALKSRLDAVNNVPQITPDKLKNLRIQLAKELKNSSDPLTYDIIDKIVKRVTVGKDNIEIELHI